MSRAPARADTDAVAAIVRRDRLVVGVGLAVLVTLAWLYLLAGAGMPAMGSGMPMSPPTPWTPAYALVVLAMWWIMMIAMMVPSAAPMILLFALISRRSRESGAPYASTAAFAFGYLLVWGAFSVGATALQYGLSASGLLTSMMRVPDATLAGGFLLAAGLYQLSPLKHACLRHCRGPVDFVSRHWRGGRGGAIRMGVIHGAYCVGCCWLVMALLFVGGVMSLVWIVALAVLVLAEKILPRGHAVGVVSGLAFACWGAWLLARNVIA